MEIGEKIKLIRNKRGLTQKELGKKIGVTAVTVGQWETGKRNPKYETLQRISNALEIDVSELFEPPTKEELKILNEAYININKAVDEFLESERKSNLNSYFDKLNSDGQIKVTAYAEVLTKVPEYRRTDQAADDQDTAADQDDQDDQDNK
jgi:transcriptional regulator with XRE-family HTH domain